jgi:hypothetical protein
MNYQDKPTARLVENKANAFSLSCVDTGEGRCAMTNQSMTNTTRTAKVYCPMCTHTVDATVEIHPKNTHVRRGQKCPRCSGSLDAGYIMHLERAA